MNLPSRIWICAALTAPLLVSTAPFAPAQAEMATKQTGMRHDAGTMMPKDHKAVAAPVRAGDLSITDVWTRQAPPSATVVGGYGVITNNGTSPDRLTGARAGFAKRVEIHEMTMTGDVMRMKEVDGGLEIKPGETVELKPGSYHIMFMQAQTPKAGETVAVTLEFEKAGNVVVNMPVAPIGANKGTSGHGMKHGG